MRSKNSIQDGSPQHIILPTLNIKNEVPLIGGALADLLYSYMAPKVIEKHHPSSHEPLRTAEGQASKHQAVSLNSYMVPRPSLCALKSPSKLHLDPSNCPLGNRRMSTYAALTLCAPGPLPRIRVICSSLASGSAYQAAMASSRDCRVRPRLGAARVSDKWVPAAALSTGQSSVMLPACRHRAHSLGTSSQSPISIQHGCGSSPT